MRGINLIVFTAVIIFGIQRVTANSEVINITITVNGTDFVISVNSSVAPAILEVANSIAESLFSLGLPVDVNECQTHDANDCDDTTELCLNFQKGFSCICIADYIRETRDGPCVQDKCLIQQNLTCNATAMKICNNIDDDLSCDCAAGHTLDNAGSCIAIDPCADDICGDSAECSANGTVPVCSCIEGYEDVEDAGSGMALLNCKAIDPCTDDVCGDSAECSANGTTPVCSCIEGYEDINDAGSDAALLNCRDIDECADQCKGPRAHCNNIAGSFECECNSGFSGDGDTCVDINECDTNPDGCHKDASCVNSVGSFTCTCDEGYTGNGQTCTDINECDTNPDDCSEDASCVNTVGSFKCTCNAGYVGSGQICTVGPGTLKASATVKIPARKRRAVNATVFEDALEQLLQTVLGFTGVTYDIDVQVVSSTTNPADSTETFELLIISTPPAKQLLENILGGLEGETVGGVTLQSILYSLNSTVTVSSSNSTITCAQVMSYVETELTNRGLITTETGVDCANTTGAIREFTVAVNNGYATVEKLGEILSNFEDFGDDEDDCAVDPCEEHAVCTDLIGAFTCACNNSYHDANLAEPGTDCISPLVGPTCKADGIEVKVYRGYLNKLEINEDHVRVNGDENCGYTGTDGQFLIYDIGFAGCGITSEQNDDSITHSFTLTNLINGWISTGPGLSFPISCSYARTFSSSDDDDEAPSVSVIRGETIIHDASGEGSLTATLTVYTDSSFTTPLEASTNVSAGESIFVKVDHSSSESSNYMKLTQCWKTTVADPNDSNRFNLIENGCSTDDDHVIIANNGANETVDFEIIVQSVHADKFYLHCDVEVCVAPCTAVCPAARRRRRAIPASGQSITPFTVGPIYVDDKGDQEDGETESVRGPNTAAIVVGVALVAALCVVAFLVVRRRMERRTRNDVYRIDDPNQPTNQDFRSSLKAGFQNSRY